MMENPINIDGLGKPPDTTIVLKSLATFAEYFQLVIIKVISTSSTAQGGGGSFNVGNL